MMFLRSLGCLAARALLLSQAVQALVAQAPQDLTGRDLELDARAYNADRQCYTSYGPNKPARGIVTKTQTVSITQTLKSTKIVKSTKTVTAPAKTVTKRRLTISKTTVTLPATTSVFTTTTTDVSSATATQFITERSTVTERTTVIGNPPGKKRQQEAEAPAAALDGRGQRPAGMPKKSYGPPLKHVTAVTCVVKATKTIRPVVTRTAKPCTTTVYPKPVTKNVVQTIGITITELPKPASTTITEATTTTITVSTALSTVTEPTTTTETVYVEPQVTGKIRVESASGQSLGYVQKVLAGGGAYFQYGSGEALTVSFTRPDLTNTFQDLRLTTNAASEFPYLVLIQGYDNQNTNISPGSLNYLFWGTGVETPANEAAKVVDNSLSQTYSFPRAIQSNLWRVNIGTGEMSPQWINEDTSEPTTFVFGQVNTLYGGGDPAAFNAQFASPIVNLNVFFEIL